MAGNISRQGILPPQAVPGAQNPVSVLIEEFPELAAEFAATTGWRDYQSYDQHSKAFRRMYPSIKPNTSGGGNFPL